MSMATSTTYLNPNASGDRASTKKFKLLTVILGITSLALFIAVIAVAVKKKSSSSDDDPLPVPPTPKVCYSPECRDAAASFLMTMNMGADPCDDFFDYVCGKWVNETRIPEEKSRFGVFDVLRDNLAKTCIEELEKPEAPDDPTNAVENSRALYQACVNTENVKTEDGVKELQKLLKSVGISDTIDTTDRPFDVYQALADITRLYGLNYIISFSVGPDDMDTAKNIIIFDQPDTFGLGRNFLLGDEGDKRVKAYKTYIKKSLCFLNDKEPCDKLEEAVEKLYRFEVNVARRTRDLVERRSAWTWYFKMSFSNLTESAQYDFLNYAKNIMETDGDNLGNETNIIVKEETYLSNLTSLLNSEEKSTMSNYLAWRLIQSFGPYLFKEFRTTKFEFDMVNEGITKARDITDFCFDATNDQLGHAVGRLYIDRAFDAESKKDVEEMVEYLGKAFRKLLDENTWMDGTTKKKSENKLEKMVDMLGYPDWTKDDKKLNDYYNLPTPLKKDDVFESLSIMMKFNAKKTFGLLPLENNRSGDWVTQASIVNAFYNPSANSITFPAGILQVPFFGKRPKYLNYGAIGYVIGHEITHGYDDQGSEFDGDGNLNNWWTDATKQEFDERKQCFIKQYSDIVDEQTKLHLNGNQTIGENIADNGGIREAYHAYLASGRDEERLPGLEHLDDKHYFFMSAANIWCEKVRDEGMVNLINDNVHAPGKYRAFIPLANTDEFAQIFNCKKGSTMNPEKRCVIW